MTCGFAASMASRARVEWAKAPPARISAATQIASMISLGVLPLRMASLVWPLMQYGHWVTCATATAMSCLVARPLRRAGALHGKPFAQQRPGGEIGQTAQLDDGIG